MMTRRFYDKAQWEGVGQDGASGADAVARLSTS